MADSLVKQLEEILTRLKIALPDRDITTTEAEGVLEDMIRLGEVEYDDEARHVRRLTREQLEYNAMVYLSAYSILMEDASHG